MDIEGMVGYDQHKMLINLEDNAELLSEEGEESDGDFDK